MYLPYSEQNDSLLNQNNKEIPTINENTRLISENICYPTFDSMKEQVINPNQKEERVLPHNPTQSFVKYVLPDNVEIAQANRELCEELATVERLTQEWIKERLNLINILEQMMLVLDYQQKEAAKKKANGTATNLVGAALIRTGLLVVGTGTTEAVVASFKEWKHAKKIAKQVQELLKRDTQMVNEIISKIYEIRSKHSDMDSCMIGIGNNLMVNVYNFVQSLTRNQKKDFKNSGLMTNDYCVSFSLASLVIKGVIPFAALPVDLLILVKETKKASGKQPSKLATKLFPVVESLKQQTRLATGLTIE